MGGIIKKGKEIKSNLFGCSACTDEKNLFLNPNYYSEVKVGENLDNNYINKNMEYFKTLDLEMTPNEYLRSFSSIHKNKNKNKNNNIKIRTPNYNLNFKEENIEKFNREKYESNPKIKELLLLFGENKDFILTEKESFYIKDMITKKILVKKLLHYKDNCYYLGYTNKDNNSKELFGTYYYDDGSIYMGFFENDKIKGRGRLILINRYIYEGDFDEGLFNGYGKLYTINGIKFEGNWKNDMQDGFGVEKYADGSCYSGTFKKGIKHGKGKFLFKNGDIYEGDFENDEMTGWGLYKRKDGKIYNGMVKKHIIEGIGVFIWKDNKRYIGEYHNELKNGFGIFYTNDGRNYAGFWKKGKQDGFGIITNVYGQKYYIKYNNGEKVTGISFSEEEKNDINKLILEEEKRIDKNKLMKIADELINQREKEERRKNIKDKINKTVIIPNEKDKNIFVKNNTKISDNNNKLIAINSNISTSYNINKTSNKNSNYKNIEISRNIHNLINSDTGTTLNYLQINNNQINNINKKMKNKSIYSKSDEDKNTNQCSKTTMDKNKSSPNLNKLYFFIINKKDDDYIEYFKKNKSRSQINIKDSIFL